MVALISMLGLNKTVYKVGATALLVILLIWFLNRQAKRIKANKERNRTEKEVDKSQLNMPDQEYRSIAFRIHNALKGVALTPDANREQTKSLRILNDLNDQEFIHVYNYFNDLIKPPDTLRTWVGGEYMPWSTEDGEALERMNDLNLA